MPNGPVETDLPREWKHIGESVSECLPQNDTHLTPRGTVGTGAMGKAASHRSAHGHKAWVEDVTEVTPQKC